MIKNYLRIAFRNFWKHRGSSAINIFGLAIGFTSCLLIAGYIQSELSYDGFQARGDRIARVIMEYRFDGGGESNKGNFTSVRVATVFTRNFPEVEAAVKMASKVVTIRYGDKILNEKRFLFADSSFFSVFSFRLLEGNPRQALSAPRKVVLTRTAAKKYFGEEDPVGKTLWNVTDSAVYQVSGLMEDCPANSQIKFDMLASFSSLGIGPEYEETYWDANYTTFLLLKNSESIPQLQAKIGPFMKKEMEGKGASVNFYLEPFPWIHLHSPYNGFEANNSITYIYVLAGVAFLILVIAGSTYINLSTARSLERAREVGIRKVVGAGRSLLFWQFIGESGILCFISMSCSLLMAGLALPLFNGLTERKLSPEILFSPSMIAFSFLVMAFVSLLAGSYPALILSGFRPLNILKGAFRHSGSGQRLRRSLIVFQFTISIFLLVSTFVIQKQIYFILHRNMGYDRQEVLVLPIDNQMLSQIPLAKTEMHRVPGVLSISRCVSSPVDIPGGYNMRSSLMPENEQLAVTGTPVDEDYIKTAGLRLVAGSDLVQQDIKDVQLPEGRVYHFILNEAAAQALGWTPEEAIGKRMFMDASRPGLVKGVVRDFHFQTLRQSIRPLILFPEMRGRTLLVKLDGQHLPETLSGLERTWKTLFPDRPFDYHFLDQDFNLLYRSEQRLGRVMDLFSGNAILLACLGLLGLSSYSVQQRTKEISVRKVLGASVTQIVLILSREFVRLTLLALLIAFPLAWWAMSRWLEDYSFRTRLSWYVFPLAGLLVLLLVFATVAFRAVRAALVSPAKNLRTE
jgi:putative ABC transport system permease protein